MSTCLITEVKQQWATLVLGWVTASVHYEDYRTQIYSLVKEISTDVIKSTWLMLVNTGFGNKNNIITVT